MRLLIIVGASLFSMLAQANVGIPVVSYGVPFLIANLLFVVALEACAIKWFYREIPVRQLLKHVFLANLFTTLIAYPLIAVVIALSPILGLNLGWLLPFENLDQMDFYVGTSTALTLIPCYFLSVCLEGRWLRAKLQPPICWRYHFLAHTLSYSFLLLQVYTQFPIRMLAYGHYTIGTGFEVVMSIFQWLMPLQ